jgi:carboxyl-terminal processing protease
VLADGRANCQTAAMKPRPLTLIGIIASMVSGLGLGIIGYRQWLAPAPALDYARVFERILEEVHQNYVHEVPKEQLIRHALRGMLSQLDGHSVYLDERAYENLQSETSGEFGGIGIELGLIDDAVTVVTTIDGTPAAAAGLQSGDRLLALDGTSLQGQRLADVVRQLRGAPGTAVQLRIQRDPDGDAWDVALTRAIIARNSVTARLLEPGYGYIRISQFQVQTPSAFTHALTDLAHESAGPLQGLVLDLRNNPGGILQASVAVADALLPDGLIVYTEGRQQSGRLTFRAGRNDLLEGAPIVVLINGASASAAEVVAGALQDHGRATVIGTRSYGKGSVQSVVPLTEGEALKLTTAYYFTPNGRSIHHEGIDPDIERAAVAEARTAEADAALLAEALQLLKQQGDSLHARL